MSRWAVIAATLLSAFQLWLWGVQGQWLGTAIALGTTLALGYAAWRPASNYTRTLMKPRVLKRGADESIRAYWFRVCLAWMLVAVCCTVGALGIPYVLGNGLGYSFVLVSLLIAVGFASILMSLQSLLYCVFRSEAEVPPKASLGRSRER